MAINNDEKKNPTIEDFNGMISEFIEWLEDTNHKSFTHVSYAVTRAHKWDVTIKFERRDE